MAAKKGAPSNNPFGRPKGSKNRINERVRMVFGELVEENLPKVRTELKKLHGKDYIKAITDLASYVVPKLQATQLNLSDEKSDFARYLESLKNENKDIEE